MTTDQRQGLAYVTEVAHLLWPEASVETTRRKRRHGSSWLLLPSADRVRLVVPDQSGAAAAVLRAEAASRGGRQGRVLTAAAGAARMGLTALPGPKRLHVGGPANSSLQRALGEILGEPVLVAWAVGPMRANRKPVLQVLSPDGRVLAYAKAGINELTRQLVRAEAAALQELRGRGFRQLVTPGVLAELETPSVSLLVLSRVDTAGPSATDVLEDADSVQRAIAQGMRELTGPGTAEVLSGSAWWQRLADRADRLPRDPAQDGVRSVVRRYGSTSARLPFGPWHGDWNPGNCAVVGGRTVVWDWERYEPDAPIGFDAQHLALQSAITVRGVAPADAAVWAIRTAPQRLAPWGLDAEAASLVAALHILDLSVRYVEDRQREAGADLGAVEAWALPVLRHHLTSTTKEGE